MSRRHQPSRRQCPRCHRQILFKRRCARARPRLENAARNPLRRAERYCRASETRLARERAGYSKRCVVRRRRKLNRSPSIREGDEAVEFVIAVVARRPRTCSARLILARATSITRASGMLRTQPLVPCLSLVLGGSDGRLCRRSPSFSLASIFDRFSGSGLLSLACCHWKRASSLRPTRQ